MSTTKIEKAQKMILSGMSIEEVAKNIEASEYDGDTNAVILDPAMWHADDGDAEITDEFNSGEEAAQDYVDSGKWGEIESTTYITVTAWREGMDDEGNMVRIDEMDHTIRIDPEAPECTDGEHDWRSDHDVVGGCKENPGVWGNGGGVVIWEACAKCGCGRRADTWAQNPANGEQGLESVNYEVGKYAK